MELWREMRELEHTNLSRDGSWLELVCRKTERLEAEAAKQTPIAPKAKPKRKAKQLTKAERKARRRERAAARLARKMAAKAATVPENGANA